MKTRYLGRGPVLVRKGAGFPVSDAKKALHLELSPCDERKCAIRLYPSRCPILY